MPNWVSINMTVSGKKEDIDCFLDAMRHSFSDEKGNKKDIPFSFHKVMPMPAALMIEAGSHSEGCYQAFFGNATEMLGYPWCQNAGIDTIEKLRAHYLAEYPDAMQVAERVRDNISKYGARHWYDWCNRNWETKWDACRPEIVRNSDTEADIRFDTAWGFPLPVIREMISLYPELSFYGSMTEESNAFWGDFDNAKARFWEPQYGGKEPDDDATEEEIDQYYSVENMLDPDDKDFSGNIEIIKFGSNTMSA